MLMMCWFYCIPLAKGLFFAAGPLFLLLSVFVLKRGVRQSRPGLRQLAFAIMLFSVLKMFTLDIYLLRDTLPCGEGHIISVCREASFRRLQGFGLLALAVCGFFLFNLYRSFAHNRPQRHITPQQAHLSLWANLSIMLVMLLIFWLAAPWAGYLTVGHVPQLFMTVPWQNLAFVNIVVLLWGFWKLVDCTWTFKSAGKDRKHHHTHVWTAKDTLWVSVVLFLIALGFSYASNDVLSGTQPGESAHLNISIDNLKPADMPGFRLPQQ